MNVYQVGDIARIDKTFTDIAGNPIDPTATSLFVTHPDGVTTEYVYNTDPEITRTGVGVFLALIPITASVSGFPKWLYRWVATGTGSSAEEALLMVEPSDFTLPPLP